MEFLFRTREPGKRQVKPSQDIALLEEQLGGGGGGDDESDDSEFRPKEGSDRSEQHSLLECPTPHVFHS